MAKILQAEELMELVREIADEFLDLDLADATPKTPLRSLGMDSLDALELATILEERLDVCIPDGRFSERDTVDGLIAALMELQAAQFATGGAGAPAGAEGEERPADVGR
jgi:acyl carrier protein